jgi:hypothetical protein
MGREGNIKGRATSERPTPMDLCTCLRAKGGVRNLTEQIKVGGVLLTRLSPRCLAWHASGQAARSCLWPASGPHKISTSAQASSLQASTTSAAALHRGLLL